MHRSRHSGKFLALVDLWGANDATSLVNIRYYYNPATHRLEPIAFNGNPLDTQDRLPMRSTFGDPEVQAAYAREAARLSKEEYITDLEIAIDDDLKNSSAGFDQLCIDRAVFF